MKIKLEYTAPAKMAKPFNGEPPVNIELVCENHRGSGMNLYYAWDDEKEHGDLYYGKPESE